MGSLDPLRIAQELFSQAEDIYPGLVTGGRSGTETNNAVQDYNENENLSQTENTSIDQELLDTSNEYTEEEIVSSTSTETEAHSAEYMEMQVSAETSDNKTVILTFNNNTSTEFSIGGWGRPQEACLTTTTGEYWTGFNSFMGITIGAHSTQTIPLTFTDAQGESLSIRIHEITSLVNGLPTFGVSGDVVIPLS